MPISGFQLVMGWVFIIGVILGIITILLGFREQEWRDKFLYFGVGLSLGIVPWGIIWLDTNL
ncbi:hypothetical protein [Altererythrobacter sp. ZODW24]|uniref:hypothetical protein n=1 Tax=Altererythrobacter sp. ZODW24 TaxID=2185142 RepID=UPI000DF83ED7|nr:hypothetical protein [Altererythrobacter sp. ZODW24]